MRREAPHSHCSLLSPAVYRIDAGSVNCGDYVFSWIINPSTHTGLVTAEGRCGTQTSRWIPVFTGMTSSQHRESSISDLFVLVSIRVHSWQVPSEFLKEF